MHPQILAKRQLDAQNRIMATTSALAEKFSVEPPAMVNQRQPGVAQMLRWEGVAVFLEALAVKVEAWKTEVGLDDILKIEGLSKTSIKAIEEHFKAKEGKDAQE